MGYSKDLSLELVGCQHTKGGEGSLLSAGKPDERGAAPLPSLHPNPIKGGSISGPANTIPEALVID